MKHPRRPATLSVSSFVPALKVVRAPAPISAPPDAEPFVESARAYADAVWGPGQLRSIVIHAESGLKVTIELPAR